MKKIKLLGISEDQNYEWWKTQLFEVIEKINLETEVEEINSVDEFVKFNVSSVPSILVDNEIVIEQNSHVVNAEEIEVALQPFFNKNPIIMKKIIVPIDFSNTSRNALLYAENLGEAINNPIKVINVCHPTTDSMDGFTVPVFDDVLKERREKLKKLFFMQGLVVLDILR